MSDLEKTYKLGIPSIDEQHAEWVEMLSELRRYSKDKNSDLIVRKIIDQILTYVDFHFAYEEKLFFQYGYPDASNHAQAHKDFLAKIKGMNHDLKNNIPLLGSTLVTVMQDWLMNHLIKEDKKYVIFLISKRVT